MGPKLLFVMGILVAHGTLGAAWLRDAAPQPHRVASATTCVNTLPAPSAFPDLSPRREILAMLVVPATLGETVQP
jgi:hypothetical protein